MGEVSYVVLSGARGFAGSTGLGSVGGGAIGDWLGILLLLVRVGA